MKKVLFLLIALISITACINPGHYHEGSEYINEPSFNLFGANLKIEIETNFMEFIVQGIYIDDPPFIYREGTLIAETDYELY